MAAREQLDDQDEPDVDDETTDEDDEESADNDPAGAPSRGRGSNVVNAGAGWALGLLLWAGVALPYLKHGQTGVKAWWMAKFLNKAADGSELP